MTEDMETRIALLERRLGVLPGGGPRQPADVDAQLLAAQMKERGFGRVFSLPLDKLKRLQKILFDSDHRPLNDKLASVQFEEDLIRQRAELIEDFEKQIQVVLESDAITALPSHEPALEQTSADIVKALEAWKTHSMEVERFRREYATLMAALQHQVSELTTQVAEAEARAARK